MSGNSRLTGAGVMLYFTCNTGSCTGGSYGSIQISQSGNGCSRPTKLNLSAPTSGTYKGILMFADRGASAGSPNFNGVVMDLDGVLYFAKDSFRFASGVCFQGGQRIALVMGDIDFNSAANVYFQRLSNPPDAMVSGGLKLVQ
jgi:hypothetical protein